MACDMPCMSYMALYVVSMHLVNSSSRSGTSTSSQHWKLNVSSGKVEPAKANSENSSTSNSNSSDDSISSQNFPKRRPTNSSSSSSSVKTNSKIHRHNDPDGSELYEERMMQILHSKAASGKEWIVLAPGADDEDCAVCHQRSQDKAVKDNCFSHSQSQDGFQKESSSDRNGKTNLQKPLTCGKKVNSTVYDHLKGISERHLHSHIPEPDVAVVFQSIGKSAEVDINDLEQRLRKTRRDIEKAGPEQREQAAQVYNLIGNFWRIKGNTQISIECFRKALSISPNNSNVLLNLARVLLNLQYLEDAILLAWQSLKLHHEEDGSTSSWLQHFTLGQALRALAEHEGSEPHPHHARQAAAHFQQALALNPGFAPAKLHLREMVARGFTGEGIAFDWLEGKAAGSTEESGTLPSATQLTLFVLLSLVVGLVSGVFISLEGNLARGDGEEYSGGGGDSGQASKSSSSSSSAQLQSSQQRHFNRAMAMRSMKLGINKKLCGRSRKNNNNGF